MKVDVFFVDSSSLEKDSLIAYFMIRVINIQQEQVKHWHKENWIGLVSLIVCSKYFVICQLTAKVPTLTLCLSSAEMAIVSSENISTIASTKLT